jgi:hypothetical protein
MALFVTSVTQGAPKFAGKPGAHWHMSPDGTRAIIEFIGTRADYAEAKADPDTTELTRREAQELGRQWDEQLGGGA